MNYKLILLFSGLSVSIFAQENTQQAIAYYDEGVKYFNLKQYHKADSLFTLSNNLEPHRDTYYSRAVCRLKMNNKNGYCEDLAHATQLGDKESHRLFWTQCGTTDTVFLDIKDQPCKREEYASLEVTYKSDLLNINKTMKYTKGSMVLKPNKWTDSTGIEHKETMPEPPGGINTFFKYITGTYKKPVGFSGTGKIYVKFIVKSDGIVAEPEILKGLPGCPECDAEAIRVIKTSTPWRPGTQDGIPANVYYTLPISVK